MVSEEGSRRLKYALCQLDLNDDGVDAIIKEIKKLFSDKSVKEGRAKIVLVPSLEAISVPGEDNLGTEEFERFGIE